jgi:LysM repeat protein
MPLTPSKLEKLKIIAYDNRERSRNPKTFTVMFNPHTISLRHENKLNSQQGSGTTGGMQEYAYSRPGTLNLDLVCDGTGVADFSNKPPVVAEQIKQFLDLCFRMDGDLHEPKFLKIQWGKGELANFDCRLLSADIEYTLFDRNGEPLHATLKTAFVADIDPNKRVALENKHSPDLSHTRIVKSGDTLPLLTKEIYGSSRYYLRVAQLNGIDDFRDLRPGQQIVFPPLDKNSE